MKCPRCGSFNTVYDAGNGSECLDCNLHWLMIGRSWAWLIFALVAILLFASVAHTETLDDQLAEFRKLNADLRAMPSAPPVSTPQVWPKPTTYAEARAQAIARGIPLVIWSGEALCPGCVKTTSADGTFVNWNGPVPGFSALSAITNAIVVGWPEGGELYHAATITQWDKLGHVNSTKAAISQFRANRITVRQDRPAMAAYQVQQTYQPQFRASAPIRAASC